jgi:hypothetical protein
MRVRKAVGPYALRRKPQPAPDTLEIRAQKIRKPRQESFTQTAQRCAEVPAEERPTVTGVHRQPLRIPLSPNISGMVQARRSSSAVVGAQDYVC